MAGAVRAGTSFVVTSAPLTNEPLSLPPRRRRPKSLSPPPATAEEGFEIVRRRLFEPLTEPEQFTQRDVVARAFYDFYRSQHQEFPPECRDGICDRPLRRCGRVRIVYQERHQACGRLPSPVGGRRSAGRRCERQKNRNHHHHRQL